MPLAPPNLGRSPLTDPRSLGSSLAFHATLWLLASIAALGIALPRGAEPPQVVHAELGPVDNRAPAETGGGGPGELGGEGTVESAAVIPEAGAADTAEALLSDVLPSPVRPEARSRALPGPATRGLGIAPGPGDGGGGGSGGGSGGGRGRGVGPGTEFFGAREHGVSFVYIIDCSGSMATRDAIGVAKRELLASLGRLPPDARFAVVLYNLRPTILTDAQGRPGMMRATAENKARIKTKLATVGPDGGTDHMAALRAGLAMRPEVVFFLTDADLMSAENVREVRSLAGDARIQAVEFGIGPALGTAVPLRQLATSTGGSYRYLDVTTFR